MSGAMSAIGTKRTSLVAPHMSAIGGKADMTVLHCKCPLLTQSGHRPTSTLETFQCASLIRYDALS